LLNLLIFSFNDILIDLIEWFFEALIVLKSIISRCYTCQLNSSSLKQFLEHQAVIVSFFELFLQLFVLLLLLFFDISVLVIPSFDFFFHALLPLSCKYLLLIYLLLYHFLVICDDLVNLNHHDFEKIVCDQSRSEVLLVPALDSHLFLSKLEDTVEKGS